MCYFRFVHTCKRLPALLVSLPPLIFTPVPFLGFFSCSCFLMTPWNRDQEQFQWAYDEGGDMIDCCSPHSLAGSECVCLVVWGWSGASPDVAVERNRLGALGHLVLGLSVGISCPQTVCLLKEPWFLIHVKYESLWFYGGWIFWWITVLWVPGDLSSQGCHHWHLDT